MSQNVDEIISNWIVACDPNQPTPDAYYVDLDRFEFQGQSHALRGTDVRSDLRKTILRGGRRTAQLFSGFRGTGKTTELRRLKRELEGFENGRHVVFLIDAAKWVTRADAPTVSELALALAGAVTEHAERYQRIRDGGDATPSKVAKMWERMWRFLTENNVELESVGLSAGKFAELKFAVRSAKPELRQAMDRQLGSRPELLQRFLHDAIIEATSLVGEHHVLTVIVDGLEKFEGGMRRAPEIYEKVAMLFTTYPEIWRLPGCHVIYTVPPYLEHFSAGVANGYSGPMRILPSIKLQSRPPKREPVAAGYAALLELLAKRVPPEDIFGAQARDAVRLLAEMSGGHVRDFFALVTEAMRTAGPTLPLTINDAERAVAALRYKVWDADVSALLQQIRGTAPNQLGLIGFERPLAIAMDQFLVLGYRNGDVWYDVHPLAAAGLGTTSATTSSDDVAESP